MSTTREIIRAARPKVHQLETDHGALYVRGLTGAGRATYLGLVHEAGDAGVPMHKTAALGLCESDGTLVFDITNEEDMTELSEMDGDLLERICLKLFDVSGLSRRAQDEAEKKSAASPS
jgi:hypothetical protein